MRAGGCAMAMSGACPVPDAKSYVRLRVGITGGKRGNGRDAHLASVDRPLARRALGWPRQLWRRGRPGRGGDRGPSAPPGGGDLRGVRGRHARARDSAWRLRGRQPGPSREPGRRPGAAPCRCLRLCPGPRREFCGGRHGGTVRPEPAPPDRSRSCVSIDNLAIGFALGAAHVNVLLAAAVIGVVSVGLTLAGLELGRRLGLRLGAWGSAPVASCSSPSVSPWRPACSDGDGV